MAKESEATTIFVQSFGELFDQDEFGLQWWKDYPVSVHQRVVYDVPWPARHQFFLYCHPPCIAELGPYFLIWIESTGTW